MNIHSLAGIGGGVKVTLIARVAFGAIALAGGVVGAVTRKALPTEPGIIPTSTASGACVPLRTLNEQVTDVV
jgi:hypothetical protein